MMSPDNGFFGYKGRLAFVDLSDRTVRIEPADPDIYRQYLGGRGVQAKLIHDHIRKLGTVTNPLGPMNRIILGTAALNDTIVPTAGRGSCSFIGTMTRSPEPCSWVPASRPLFGLVTHASCGGLFPNMLKRAGFDHLIIDGKASSPVRILAENGHIRILDAEGELFEAVAGRKVPRRVSRITDILTRLHPGSSTVCLGPAGWNQVAFACLTADRHRNFGRGGAGAVFGSKNLVAVTACGREPVASHDHERFSALGREIDDHVKRHVGDRSRPTSFRPTTGTTHWLDRAFNGKFMGIRGGYLPWHNYDEGSFPESDYAGVSTEAFLEISGKHSVCNRCRYVMCTRTACVDKSAADKTVRPEFETIALLINCGLLDREAIVELNHLCNEFGVDTMTFGGVMAGAMELGEKGLLRGFKNIPGFGSAADMIRALESIVYRSDALGKILGTYSDRAIAGIAATLPMNDPKDIVHCVTTSFGGLGYAGILPKAFPGMFAAYGTSNRGRGDHTYAWTIQAEEGGLKEAEDLAAYIASSQSHKALIDSLGLCDFFPEDVTSDSFLSLYHSLTDFEYTRNTFNECGRRIYSLERHLNNLQGRNRDYDAYVPPKMLIPMKRGAHQGESVDPDFFKSILDHYYEKQGWTNQGVVPEELMKELGIKRS